MDNILTLFIGNMTKEISAFIEGYIAEGLDLEQLQIIFFKVETTPSAIFFSVAEEQKRVLRLPTIQEAKEFLNKV